MVCVRGFPLPSSTGLPSSSVTGWVSTRTELRGTRTPAWLSKMIWAFCWRSRVMSPRFRSEENTTTRRPPSSALMAATRISASRSSPLWKRMVTVSPRCIRPTSSERISVRKYHSNP